MPRVDDKKLELAKAYIDANLQRPLRLSNIAARAGISARTLQRHFKDELGFSPSQYVLYRRLMAVRAVLKRSDVTTASVAKVASDYGLHHAGRFSGTYYSLFGESPHHTLQRPSSRKV